ncbi:MAG: hypothetical protein H6Q37_2552 [Chloroflexi bacterium]|jgi:hypothetical protein|nr:hypothetical protein [Chloroflexota bacterium]
MTRLTIFSAPKPFTNPHINIIQRNAVQTWRHLGPDVEVFLMGDEPGMAQVAAEYGVRQFADVRRNEQGTPLVSSMVELARNASQSPILVCVNADILFLPDLISAVRKLTTHVQKYLLIGQRWDLEVRQLMEFTDGWDARLRADIQARGQLHAPSGSDFFVFPRGLFTAMPDFAIGRAGWDNWMIYEAKRQSWPVIDGTPSLTVVHQNHDYSHLPGGRPHYELPESHKNQALAGGLNHMYMILDSDKQLRDGKLRPPPITLVRSIRQAEVWLTPADGRRSGIRWSLARQMRRLRRRITGSL